MEMRGCLRWRWRRGYQREAGGLFVMEPEMEAERRHDRAEMEAEQLDHVKGVEKDPRFFIRVDYVPSDLIRSKGCGHVSRFVFYNLHVYIYLVDYPIASTR
ncbi:hypothetical protein Dimus_035150 [Dionaea muscipula]